MKGNENLILGENSYQGVIDAIKQKMASTRTCDTILGNDLLGKAYQKLNESTTPILDLKEFTTNAEKVAPDDATLCDIVEFCRQQVKGGDLNFLINLCKEEHFKNLGRAYHPSPDTTIQAFKNMFDTTGTSLENAIKNGIFDSMKSDLLGILKSELSANEEKKLQTPLNESLVNANKTLLRYSPIGIRCEDLSTNTVVHLMEHDVISINPDTKECTRLNEEDLSRLNIPPSYRRMMGAMQMSKYDPVNETFSLNEHWDFDCKLQNGECYVNGKPIQKDELKQLLLESVNTYEAFPGKVENFNRARYLMDADNMMILFENYDKIVKYDNLEVVKSLNESDRFAKYVIIDRAQTLNGNVPRVVAASDKSIDNKLFESFEHMTQACDSILGDTVVSLFESQINTEHEVYRMKNEKKMMLQREIGELNENLKKLESVARTADADSPFALEVERRKIKLNESLNDKINQLTDIDKEFSL